ncbi:MULTISPECIES: VWA domain-containing protein [unclassified Oceanispirochaeta]|uniref:vWA domain-containing protein n=1 Tax=unclassified Oceanispirochaeta TaxID=2635722 RepID=UPI000E09C651|nr:MULTISPECIES: vWA domain-containing protein [unclassified Oceanispirochaeta]MBF9017641.1 VWA domain-containing protein [Oceanispirochaeta sp. M2]NPD74213.1 VWA domain-containing protein [Oceanispirochaeta sp. M1]RDG29919.1 VWA domain-containing protein [Oceanispirochaeta sp. M1]
MKKIITLLSLVLFLIPLYSQQNISVTGVDSSEMLVNGNIHIYVSLEDSSELQVNEMPELNDFSLFEKERSSEDWITEDLIDLQFNGVNQDQISFTLLLDNSGSMYDTLSAKPTDKKDEQRIHFVLKALQDLFSATTDYKDNISIVSFNTNIETLTSFTDSRTKLLSSLDGIIRPTAEDSYTELYRAMKTASDQLSMRKGRKVLILLSDGENYTYSENRKEPHPLFGNELLELRDLEKEMQKRGITLYTIHYARDSDSDLTALSRKTGGLSYTASSRNELLTAYKEIHSRINNEFRLSYKPGVSAARERSIKVSLGDRESSSEFTFLWEIFWGLSPTLPWWVYCILSALAVLLVFIIHRTPFEKIYSFPHLEVLAADDSDKTVIQISHDKTMIAVSRDQTQIMDESEFENKDSDETGITIIKDSDGKYQLKADHEIMVNNKTVINRELEAGDVIRSEGTMIIFDEPAED